MDSLMTAIPDLTIPHPAPAIVVAGPPRQGLLAHLTASAVGAGLDNLFRQVVVVALTVAASHAYPDSSEKADALAASYSSWALMLFSAPFILLAPLAGSLGDRIPKHLIIRAARIADVPIAILGIWGFAISSPWMMLGSYFLLAIASTFFSPAKLAIMPELVDDAHLARGNAALAAVTVAAILLGTCLAACTDSVYLAAALRELMQGSAIRASHLIGDERVQDPYCL